MTPAEHPSPRIYVASLSDYNAGRLWGRWIEADQSIEAISAAVEELLRLSPEPGAEEWAIHDYEGFGPLRLGEYENLEQVATIGRGIAEHGVAFAHWADYLGRDQWDDLAAFDDVYDGEYPDLVTWATEQLEALGIDPNDQSDDDPLARYWHFDMEAYANDLAADFIVCPDDSGVYVFWS